jgi:uncharacterized membrane protein
LVPGLLGFLTGAVIFGLTYQQVFPQISKIAKLGNVTLPEIWHLNPYLTVFVFSLLSLILFYLIDRVGMQRKKDKEENEDN